MIRHPAAKDSLLLTKNFLTRLKKKNKITSVYLKFYLKATSSPLKYYSIIILLAILFSLHIGIASFIFCQVNEF